MCLALPAEVVSIDREIETATVSLGGVRKTISIALVDELEAGDFVLVHVGYALNTISPEEAARTLSLISEAGLMDDALADAAPMEAAP